MQESEQEPVVTTPQSSFSTSSYSNRPKKRGVIIRWVAVLLILGLLAFGAYNLFNTFTGESEEEATPTPTAAPIPTDTPTPQPTSLTPTKAAATPTRTPTPTKAATSATKGVTLRVLNGTTITGEAARARDFLQGLGYTVSSIGNAETQDYTKTEIRITASKEGSLATLKKDIETKYPVGTTSATLSTSEGVDAIVITGK